MPTPTDPTSSSTQWSLLGALGIVLAAGLRYIAKGIRLRRPSIVDGNGPLTLAELQIGLATIRQHSAQIKLLQESMDILNNSMPAFSKRLYQVESEQEESRREQETLASKLDDLARNVRVGLREIKDAIADLRPGSTGE